VGQQARQPHKMRSGQLVLLDRLLRVRTTVIAGLAVTSAFAPHVGPNRWLIAGGIAVGMIPYNEFIRRRVTQRWQRLPAAVPWIDLIAVLIAVVVEPTMWAAGLIINVANFTLPFGLFSRRYNTLLVTVAASFYCTTFQAAPRPHSVSLLIAGGFGLPLLFQALSGFANRDRVESARGSHLLNGLDAVAWEYDPELEQYTFVSERAERRFKTSASIWMSDPDAWLHTVHPDDRSKVTAANIAVSSGKQFEIRTLHDGESEWWRVSLSDAIDDADRLIHGVMVDITDLRTAQEALRRQAERDSLTGLPNRSALLSDLDRRTRQATADFGLLMIDLDAFKHVNDSLGHVAGDALLIEMARRLTDLSDADGLVARLGGDEFAVVVAGDDARARTLEVARRIAASLSTSMCIMGAELRLSASVGVAMWPDDAVDPASLLRRADLTMYVAKRGHLGVATFETRHDETSGRTARLMMDFPGALDNGEIVAHFQPRVRLDDETMVGAEALARWTHPTLGEIAPVEFIPIAEMTGKLTDLTRVMITQASRAAQKWRALGVSVEIAINVTATDLLSTQIIEVLEGLPAATGQSLSSLVLEITETQVMEHLELVQPTLDRLDQLGIRLSLDDFGTGHSSFARLRDLRMSELKIDKSFVTDLAAQPANEPIVRSIIELARNLGLTTVAEGIEDEATLERLRALGCNFAQGYHLGRPVSVEEFERRHLRVALPIHLN
jgi:diguanylate cyclase (GGDEF)-like protein